MEKPIMITEFYITNLYKERDVKIKFDSPYKILVAENGYGKTTILNSFYALLSGDISKLRKVNFSEIGLVFSDDVNISFKKSDFDIDLESIKGHALFEHLESKLGQDYILELINDVRRYSPQRMEASSLFRHAVTVSDLPSRMLREYLREIRSSRVNKKVNSATQILISFICFFGSSYGLLWIFSSASLASGYCGSEFSLFHSEFRCRQPYLAMIMFISLGISFIVFFWLAFCGFRSTSASHKSQPKNKGSL